MRAGGLEQWTRTFAGRSPSAAGGAEGTVRGVVLGWDARLARGFHFGMAAMPELTVSSPAGAAPGFDAALEGGWYALRGGWRSSALFVDTSLSRGSYRAASVIGNPAAGGTLGGGFDLVQDHARARAGARFEFGGLRATPSVALFSGSLRQGGWTAHGAALRAEVPGISQRYRGWKARLDLAPSGWREGPGMLRWRPGVHLSATRTRTRGPAWLDVAQSDRAGVLSFTSRARVQGLPRRVHGLGTSLTVRRSDTWRVRAGYAGMMVDGDPVHAVVVGLHLRF